MVFVVFDEIEDGLGVAGREACLGEPRFEVGGGFVAPAAFAEKFVEDEVIDRREAASLAVGPLEMALVGIHAVLEHMFAEADIGDLEEGAEQPVVAGAEAAVVVGGEASGGVQLDLVDHATEVN